MDNSTDPSNGGGETGDTTPAAQELDMTVNHPSEMQGLIQAIDRVVEAGTNYMRERRTKYEEYKKSMQEGGYLSLSDLNDEEDYPTEIVAGAMIRQKIANDPLDSSVVCGYIYEHNAVRNFESEDETDPSIDWVQVHDGEINVTVNGLINLYHYLVKRYEYAQPVHRYFRDLEALQHYVRHSRQVDPPLTEAQALKCMREKGANDPDVAAAFEHAYHQSWLTTMRNFKEKHGYGDRVTYTYNFDNDLNQGIQYIEIEFEYDPLIHPEELEDYDGETIAIVQSHNGADARGGLSDPVGFRVVNKGISMNVDYNIYAQLSEDHYVQVSGNIYGTGSQYAEREINEWLNDDDNDFTFVHADDFTDEHERHNVALIEAGSETGYYVSYTRENLSIRMDGRPLLDIDMWINED